MFAAALSASIGPVRLSGSLRGSPLQDAKLNSIGYMQSLAAAVERRRKSKQLPRSINKCLDEFTKKIAKAKSFH